MHTPLSKVLPNTVTSGYIFKHAVINQFPVYSDLRSNLISRKRMCVTQGSNITVANAPGGLSFSLQLQIPLFCLLNVGEISIMKAEGSGLVQSTASVNLCSAPRPRDSSPQRGEFISLAHSLENKSQEFCLPLISTVG